ncbi:MAG: hypothetical protein ABR936_11835 [Bacteroidota bacterium]|jgi:hypothetical protein
MGKIQRQWAKRKLKELIHVLGGKCAVIYCDSDDLEIHHINGRDYEPRELEYSHRVSRYWQEYRAGVALGVLCSHHNSEARFKPSCQNMAVVIEEPPF